jgi:DNA-binding MurR/RpiR family transcriptional regulator
VLAIEPVGRAPDLLERIHGARHRGARILSLHRNDAELTDLSHETLTVDRSRPARDFDVTQHLLTDLAPLSTGYRPW